MDTWWIHQAADLFVTLRVIAMIMMSDPRSGSRVQAAPARVTRVRVLHQPSAVSSLNWQGSANITTITWQLDHRDRRDDGNRCKKGGFKASFKSHIFYFTESTRKILPYAWLKYIRNIETWTCFFLSILIKVNPPKPELILTLAFRVKTQGEFWHQLLRFKVTRFKAIWRFYYIYFFLCFGDNISY